MIQRATLHVSAPTSEIKRVTKLASQMVQLTLSPSVASPPRKLLAGPSTSAPKRLTGPSTVVPVCTFFLQNNCKFGAKCRNRHG